jgi:large subunit ribosomal protein L17
MKHQSRKGRRFGRERKERDALVRSLAVSLILHGKILTTEAKAKELARVIEPYVTTAKKGTLHARRGLLRELPETSVRTLMNDIAPRFKERHGGYTRRVKVHRKRTDAAPMARIEFVQ